MKNLMSVLVLAVAGFAVSAHAADEKKPTAQQSKMATCNKDAAEKKGDERKAFMKTCLSAKKTSQQEKMKSCNASAADKKGAERKAHMSACLKA